MYNEDALNLAFRTFIRALLAMPANSWRQANKMVTPGVSLPTGALDEQFGTVLIASFEPPSGPVKTEKDLVVGLSMTQTVTTFHTLTFSLNLFRGDAKSKLERLSSLLQTASAIESLGNLGLGLLTISPVRDLSGLVSNSLMEARAQIDLTFSYAVSEEINLASLDKAGLTVIYQGNTNATFTEDIQL